MHSIRTHLIGFFLILIFLPVGLTSWSFSNAFQRNVKDFVEQATLNILTQSLQQVTSLVKSAEQAVEYQNDILKKQVVAFEKGDNTQSIRELLKASIANQSMLKNIGVVNTKNLHFFMSYINPNGQLVNKEVATQSGKLMTRFWTEVLPSQSASNDDIVSEWHETQFRVESRPWYQTALSQTGDVDYEASWTEPYIFEQSGEVGISFAKAVNKPGQGFREPFAIAFVDVSLEGISQLLQNQEIGKDSHLILVNNKNQVLASSIKKNKSTNDSQAELPTIYEIGTDFLNSNIWNNLQATHQSEIKHKQENKLQSYIFEGTEYYARALELNEKSISQFEWTLWVFVPKNALLYNYYKSRTLTYWLTGISVVLALMISLYIWLKISRQLNSVVNAFNRVQKGDFKTRLVLNNSYSEFEELKSHFNKMLVTLQENTLMERLISKRARQDIAQNISLYDDGIMLKKGTRIQRTILFSDIRGFTNYSEYKEPEEIVAMLNKYLGIHAEVIEELGGDVDKYVGDEVMATFDGLDSEIRAVNAAIKICQRIQDYKTVHNLGVGIGIHNGLVVNGYIGSEGRAQFTSIGSTVNFAARLCSNARKDEIWVSETIYNSCSDTIAFKYLGEVEFKGFQHPQKVYVVSYK